jgi:hypothetical protein
VQPGEGESYCLFHSGVVPMALGVAIANSLARHYFADAVHEGDPEGGHPECPTLSIFAPGRVIVIEVANPGNEVFCDSPTGSSIKLMM